MIGDGRELLLALQHADSFFPTGAVSFSWGLEALQHDRQLAGPEAVGHFAAGQLRCRWATLDRPVLVAAHRQASDPLPLLALDKSVEALSLAQEFRDGSRRMGLALLDIHTKLGTGGAADYRRRVGRGEAPGHLAVVQGLLWRNLGLDEQAAAAVAAYGMCVSILGAAIRLGLIGHVDCQRCLARLGSEIVAIIGSPLPSLDEIGAFTPHIDIASMRHETQPVRLFAN